MTDSVDLLYRIVRFGEATGLRPLCIAESLPQYLLDDASFYILEKMMRMHERAFFGPLSYDDFVPSDI